MNLRFPEGAERLHSILLILVVIGVWILLQTYILPKMGVST
jgi:hypothetical protein